MMIAKAVSFCFVSNKYKFNKFFIKNYTSVRVSYFSNMLLIRN